MKSKNFVIEKVLLTKSTIRMHKHNIPTLIQISPFQVPGELSLGVKLLFFKNASFLLQANIAKASFVIFFQMFFQKGNVGEFPINFARLSTDLDKALELA